MGVFIMGSNIDNLVVLPAPKRNQRFRCEELGKRRRTPQPWWNKYGSLYNEYWNIQKNDLRHITANCRVPLMPIYEKCTLRNNTEDHTRERRFFSPVCGHFACLSCWLKHAKSALERELSPIPCPSATCEEKLTISRDASIFSDSALEEMIEVEWSNKKGQGNTLQCAQCK
ncbi:hypothetical protein PMAYCL1PPCAC_10809, partial [Pristionchus mayeri]